jgi:lipopolysaccharide/colanic/teichoic acid biosynthesis glycosyltransferase
MGGFVASGLSRIGDIAKRLVDVVGAALLLVLCLPLIVAVALWVKLDSPGPVFFRCVRLGFGGREFRMLKFRKMRDGATGPALTSSDDPRFTRVGRWLAWTKLDEIPQLWNVLTGAMSLVGPRPEHPSFVQLQPDEYAEILQVRPGMTGLSQLAFAKEAEVLGPDAPIDVYEQRLLPQKISLDRMYVRQRSLAVDLKILVWTAVAVLLRRRVAVHRESGKLGLRRRTPEARVVMAEEVRVKVEA